MRKKLTPAERAEEKASRERYIWVLKIIRKRFATSHEIAQVEKVFDPAIWAQVDPLKSECRERHRKSAEHETTTLEAFTRQILKQMARCLNVSAKIKVARPGKQEK